MTANAMGFSSVNASDRVGSERIFSARRGLEVAWIYTKAVIAKVVKLLSFWNWTYQCHVCKTVSKFLILLTTVAIPVNTEIAISGPGNSTFPQPAVGFSVQAKANFYFGHKTVKWVFSRTSLHCVTSKNTIALYTWNVKQNPVLTESFRKALITWELTQLHICQI